MSRRHEIDALRGLMLILMTLTHLPTRFSEYTGEPFGFVSAAEGFVFLSAFMVGWIYVARAHKNGIPAMRRAVWRRAFTLYACQVGLLLFLLTVVVPIGVAKSQPAITNLVSFFNREHLAALSSGLVLLYDPPLLDILPLYVLFMLATPAVLALSLRRGWAPILSFSFGLWLVAQFDVGQAVYQAIASATRFNMPYAETGAFSLLAWQLLWIIGLWMGSRILRASGYLPAGARPLRQSLRSPWLGGGRSAADRNVCGLVRGRRAGVARCRSCRRRRERQTDGHQFRCGAIADFHSA